MKTNTGNPISIFHIDDDADDLFFFKQALNNVDPTITHYSAKGCDEAFDMLKKMEEKPYMIFVDLNMPTKSGKDFLIEQKTYTDLKDIPVVVFTTSSSPKDRNELSALGAKRFITKPNNINGIEEVIKELVYPYESADY